MKKRELMAGTQSFTDEEKETLRSNMSAAADTEFTSSSKGLVPAPSAEDSILSGDGAWKSVETIDAAYVDALDWSTLPMVKIGSHYYTYTKIGSYYYTTENLYEKTGQWKTWNNKTEQQCYDLGFGLSYSNTRSTVNSLNALMSDGWCICTYSALSNLVSTAGGSSRESALKLMSKTGWTNYTGTDIYSFNAKPAGEYDDSSARWYGEGTICIIGSNSFDGLFYNFVKIEPSATTALKLTYTPMSTYWETDYVAMRACKAV